MIRLESITKSYDENNVIANFNYVIKKGDYVYITGKSGKGKSTLLYIISELENPTSGRVIYDKELKKGFLFQNYALLSNKTTLQNINLIEKYPIAQVKMMLDEFNLPEEILKRKVYSLSGGEQQRVSLIRQILRKPDIIFADEPTGNLDKDNEEIIINKLKELNKSGMTVIISTHNLALINNEKVINL